MLNPFPNLLTLGLVAPFLIRLILALTVITLGKHKLKSSRKDILGYIEIVAGVFLVLGFLTQVAALVLILLFGYELYKKIKSRAFLSNGVNYYFILFVLSLSLLLSGAGAYAFDLPL